MTDKFVINYIYKKISESEDVNYIICCTKLCK